MTITGVVGLGRSRSNSRDKSEWQQITLESFEKPGLFEYDSLLRKNYPVICGIDEAGRGPLAGDVYAAAVIFEPDAVIYGVDDSKKLTEKERERLYDEIKYKAKAYCVASASVEEIEKYNILRAALLAMKRAYEGLGLSADLIIADGNKPPPINGNVRALIKGDTISASVAAASILAKVERDRYMKKQAQIYPMYGFDKHKGYPTKVHYEAVDKYGLCPIHRTAFFKKYNLRKNEQK